MAALVCGSVDHQGLIGIHGFHLALGNGRMHYWVDELNTWPETYTHLRSQVSVCSYLTSFHPENIMVSATDQVKLYLIVQSIISNSNRVTKRVNYYITE